MPRCYEPAHIVGVSKTAYAPATPRRLHWRRDLQRTSAGPRRRPDSQAPCSPACSSSSRRSPRPRRPAAGVLVLDGVLVPDGRAPSAATVASRRAPRRARRGRRRRPRRHDGLRRRDPGRGQPRPGAARCAAPGGDRCRRRRGRVRRRQRLAFPGVPGAAPPTRRSRSTARERRPPAGWPPPTRPRTCRGTRSTSGPPTPRRGCPSTAPRTGSARSTATSPGTTSCARRPSTTGCPPMYADPTHDPRMQR